MDFIKTMFGLLFFFLAIGAGVSIITFVVDVFRWHDKEEKIKVVPSNDVEPNRDYTESEVSNLGDESGKYNTSTLSDTWL